MSLNILISNLFITENNYYLKIWIETYLKLAQFADWEKSIQMCHTHKKMSEKGILTHLPFAGIIRSSPFLQGAE